MHRIRKLFKPQIEWYKKYLKLQNNGEVDDSYIYDCAIEEFETCTRGNWLDLLEILTEDKE